MDKSLPVIAIIGSANAGKSTLFNAIVGAPQAIVAKEAGTTRDAVTAKVEFNGKAFWLIDTAGLKKADDTFEATIQNQIDEVAELANVIIVTVDSTKQIVEQDRIAAKKALKSKKAVILALNKIDHKGIDFEQFNSLGIKEIYKIQANQRRGIEGLLTHATSLIPHKKDKIVSHTTVAIIGRSNMGKSHLFNAIGKKQQAIVSEQISTTRDINRIGIKYHEQTFEFWDTAGIRRPGKVSRGVEAFSMARTLYAIDNADICLLVIDASEVSTALDKKIAGIIKDAGKPMILVVNKWDLIEKEDKTQQRFSNRLARDLPFVWWVPLIFVSALEGTNVTKMFDLINEVITKADREISTRDLNRILKETTASHPPAGLKNRHPKLRYMTQIGTQPPAFAIFGSQLEFLHWSYKRHIENELRDKYDFAGTPLIIEYRDRDEYKEK